MRRKSAISRPIQTVRCTRSLLRIDGPSLAERSRVGCKEQRSAEYRAYSSEWRRKRVGGVELGSAMPVAGGLEPFQGSNPADDLAPPARRCGGYAQQAPRAPNGLKTERNCGDASSPRREEGE